jgi:hypothetical protein
LRRRSKYENEQLRAIRAWKAEEPGVVSKTFGIARMATSNSSTCGRVKFLQARTGGFSSFLLSGCSASEARQAGGERAGSGGQATHPAGAVHRLVLWAGGLSTAGEVLSLPEP